MHPQISWQKSVEIAPVRDFLLAVYSKDPAYATSHQNSQDCNPRTMDQIVENYRHHFRLHSAAKRGDDHWALLPTKVQLGNQTKPSQVVVMVTLKPLHLKDLYTPHTKGIRYHSLSVFMERLTGIQTATISILRSDLVDGLNLLRLDRRWMKC